MHLLMEQSADDRSVPNDLFEFQPQNSNPGSDPKDLFEFPPQNSNQSYEGKAFIAEGGRRTVTNTNHSKFITEFNHISRDLENSPSNDDIPAVGHTPSKVHRIKKFEEVIG